MLKLQRNLEDSSEGANPEDLEEVRTSGSHRAKERNPKGGERAESPRTEPRTPGLRVGRSSKKPRQQRRQSKAEAAEPIGEDAQGYFHR